MFLKQNKALITDMFISFKFLMMVMKERWEGLLCVWKENDILTKAR